ncbi:MAG: proton-conducting transporter membrane subunit [Methanomicrobiales archaeon]|nr:proton-conducting transporter membrane subunit [Methanomicrobiales archaeon]
MEPLESPVPFIAILVPFCAAALILLSYRRRRLIEAYSLLASILTFALVLILLPRVMEGSEVTWSVLKLLPGANLGLHVDAFGLIFALTSSSLWIVSSLYSIGYMNAHDGHNLARFYAAFAIAIASALAVAMAANLFTLFIFYEILTISTYPLVVHEGTEEAMRAGRKYLAYLLTAGVFLLLSLLFTQHLAGGNEFTSGGILAGHATDFIVRILFLTFLIGFAKAAWMPLHSWLPTAMVAPTPVSALLHAVAVVKAGAFGMMRVICYIFGLELASAAGLNMALILIASVTILVSSFFALAQDNLKRRLAYSTIGQLSYILLGVALLTPQGIAGALLHIPFHAYMKITLFFTAGCILVSTGLENISEMKGIGRRMPLTMGAFTLGAIGVCGFPPLCGFFSKLLLAEGSVEAGAIPVLLVLLSSSVLNAAYFFPIIRTAFLDDPAEELRGRKEAPVLVLIPSLATALLSLLMGLYPAFPFLELATMAVRALAGGP